MKRARDIGRGLFRTFRRRPAGESADPGSAGAARFRRRHGRHGAAASIGSSAILAIWLTVASVLFPIHATAHAIVVRSTPAANSEILSGDIDIRVEFNTLIDPQRSRLRLIDDGGSDLLLDMLPDIDAVAITAIAHDVVPGNYSLQWLVLSQDGHITRGDLSFHVKPR